MSILVVGSIALDTIETPYGNAPNSPGGSALYFSAAARFFSPVNVVGVVGEDFPFDCIDFLKNDRVNLDGLMVEKGQTFRWGGRYHENINERDTLFTYLNVFENFHPVIPDQYRNSDFLFLANIAPELQLEVLENVNSPKLTVLDTMNFWISGRPEALAKVIERADVMIVNDEEIIQLTGIQNIHRAAKDLLSRGLKGLVVKKGEHGAVMITRDDYFVAPGFPVEKVVDPTGAGDSFAGGFVGYLASANQLDNNSFRKAVVYGSTVASYNVEDFSFNKLKTLTPEMIESRFEAFREMMRF
ncbi:MAG: PfkB family carbohydrate kinase [Calditrichia bacterium]